MSSPRRSIGAEQLQVGSEARLRGDAARWMVRAGSVVRTTTRRLRDRSARGAFLAGAFFLGAFFLGTVFLQAQKAFGRVYFANLAGSGLCGLLVLAAMPLVAPENLLIVPLLL